MKRISFPGGLPALCLAACLLALLSAACTNNCPDYPIEPDVLRFLPYQANQAVVFEDASLNLDTLVVSAYSRGFTTEVCANHPNQDFEYERIHITLGNTTGDSTFVLLDNTTWEKLAIRFAECCDLGRSFDPLTGTLDSPVPTNAETFTFAASENVNGTTYQNVSTYTNSLNLQSRIQAVKIAMDHGIVAYQNEQGVWWYLN